MATDQDREGIQQVLLERFERQRLPRILALKDQVDQGLKLHEVDLDFLSEVLSDAQQNAHLIAALPECQDLYARVMHLYREITEKALANEQGG
jgi:DNA-binding FadR family transcriptional regulator